MEIDKVEKFVIVRNKILTKFLSLRDYKQNPNSLMKEYDFAKFLNETIKDLDEALSDTGSVNFEKSK